VRRFADLSSSQPSAILHPRTGIWPRLLRANGRDACDWVLLASKDAHGWRRLGIQQFIRWDAV
jgi:hypothetical protein